VNLLPALPDVQALGCDLKMEQGARACIKEGIAQCEASRD
jgi:bacterioferritin (cytochrome b1)